LRVSSLPIRRNLTVNLVAIVSVGTVALGVLIVLALLARPISDDFSALYRVAELGLSNIGFDLRDSSGRYSNVVLYVVGYLLFGNAALWIVPLAMLVALSSALAIVGMLLSGSGQRPAGAICGAVAGILVTALQPGLFDVFAWYTSSTLYFASLSALATVIAVLLLAVRSHGKRRTFLVVTLGLAVLVHQGFSETTALYVIIVSFLAAVICLVRRTAAWRGPALVLLGSSVVGFAMAFLAPGRENRLSGQLQQATDVVTILLSSIRDSVTFIQEFTSPSVLLLVALGAVLGTIVRPTDRRRALLAILGLLAFAGTAVLFTSLVVHAVSGGGDVPWRAWAFPSGACAIAIVGVVAVVVSRIPVRKRLSQVISGVVVLLCIAGLVGWKPAATQTIVAESVRASAFDFRSASIAAQVASGAGEVAVVPLPILLPWTDTTDYLTPNSSIPIWSAEEGLRRYYGLDDSSTVGGKQLMTYCRPGFVEQYWAIKSCEQLADEG
jgi:hypothetical protein